MSEQAGSMLPGAQVGYHDLSEAGPEALTSTLDAITGPVSGLCEYPIVVNPATNPFLNFNEVTVAVDCQIVSRDQNLQAATGWHFDDVSEPTAVIIHGTDCQRISRREASRIRIGFGCIGPLG
jgi:hypothetical protein